MADATNFTKLLVAMANQNGVLLTRDAAQLSEKELLFSNALIDMNISVIPDEPIPLTIFDPKTGKYEQCTIETPSTDLSADRTQATVLRGISPYSTDWLTESTNYSIKLSKGSRVSVGISPQFIEMVAEALNAEIGSKIKFNATPSFDVTAANVANLFPSYADATARNAAIAAPANGMVVYNIALGANQQYIGGGWASFATGSVVNGDETTAGKFELATIAEVIASTDTGGSATVVVRPSHLSAKVQDSTVTDVVVSNTTTETTVYSFTVPANTLQLGRYLKLKLISDSFSLTNTKSFTIKVKLGSTTLFSQSYTSNIGAAQNSGYFLDTDIYYKSLGGQLATYIAPGLYSDGGEIEYKTETSAEDEATNLDLDVTVQFNNASADDNFTMSGAFVSTHN